MTDNGTNFTSFKFKQFLRENGVHHKLTAPFHPALNGQAERYVQILKKSLKAMRYDHDNNKNLELCKLLLQYRRTPHTVTGKSPSERVFGWQIRSRLDCMKPEKESRKSYLNKDKRVRDLNINTRVSVRDYFNDRWKFGKILSRIGKLHYTIKLDDGRTWCRHIDQIREVSQNTLTRFAPH